MNHKASVEQVRVEDLHKSYGDHEVLKGVSLTANSGDVISIIGSSGSGKSTGLRCINFLECPTAGRILVAGKEVELVRNRKGELTVKDARQLQQIRTRLSMVFQHFNLWSHMTVLENVVEAPVHVLGLSKAEARERAERYLERVGVWKLRDAYPAHMSGGQQHRRLHRQRARGVEPRDLRAPGARRGGGRPEGGAGASAQRTPAAVPVRQPEVTGAGTPGCVQR